MKRYLFLTAVVTSLAGCGDGDRLPPLRSILVEQDRVCYSVNKNDALSSYTIDSIIDGKHKKLLMNERVVLHYPDTCINITLPRGYVYSTTYKLNGEYYRHAFFIDNNGMISSFSRDK